MDVTTRYSSGAIVETRSMTDAIQVFEGFWLTPFWTPSEIQADKTFVNEQFKYYCDAMGISFRQSPPCRHSKNAIELKHGVIRDIHIRLKVASPDVPNKLLVLQAIRISYDLYGNDTASANELAKG